MFHFSAHTQESAIYRDDQEDGKHTKHSFQKSLQAEKVIKGFIKEFSKHKDLDLIYRQSLTQSQKKYLIDLR